MVSREIWCDVVVVLRRRGTARCALFRYIEPSSNQVSGHTMAKRAIARPDTTGYVEMVYWQ